MCVTFPTRFTWKDTLRWMTVGFYHFPVLKCQVNQTTSELIPGEVMFQHFNCYGKITPKPWKPDEFSTEQCLRTGCIKQVHSESSVVNIKALWKMQCPVYTAELENTVRLALCVSVLCTCSFLVIILTWAVIFVSCLYTDTECEQA